jgi:hypothetical protein
MKNVFLIGTILFFMASDCICQTYSEDQRMVGGTFRNRSQTKGKPLGSPYQQIMFASARVSNIPNPVYMRFNVFTDEFEFITPKNDTLVADKIETFSDITFTGSNTRYLLLPYTNHKNQLNNGYLMVIYQKGDYVLLKKENIHFVEEKIAKTTLEMSMPAKYVKSADTYYLKYKDQITAAFCENKKALIKLYPDKKAATESFLKENKISFEEQSDMIKIVDFLVGL